MLTVQQAKKELKVGIASYLFKDASGKYVLPEVNKLPFYLSGAPGIGKTQIVEQIANEQGLGLVSTSMAHHTKNTLLGIPTITEREKATDGASMKYIKHPMSDILEDVWGAYEKGKKEGILLLDEFDLIEESLIAPMLAFLQTKRIGNYALPEGWIIVLCSNLPEYYRTAKEFDIAVMDRVRVLPIEFDAKEFLDYGAEIGIHPIILEYLRIHKNHVYLYHDKTEFITARGWENLSCCIKVYECMKQEVKKELILQYIKSEEVANAFFTYYNTTVSKKLPTEFVPDILNGVNVERSVMLLNCSNSVTKWKILNQLFQNLAEHAKEYDDEYKGYMQLKKMYQYFDGKQESIVDAGELYTLLCELADGKQVLQKDLEQGAFGKMFMNEDGWKLCWKVTEKIRMKQMQNNRNNIDKKTELNMDYSNDFVLEVMEEYVSDLKNELKQKMRKTNNEISNVILFLHSLETKEEDYMNHFMEKISEEQSILNVMFICTNKEYADSIYELYGTLGKDFKAEEIE